MEKILLKIVLFCFSIAFLNVDAQENYNPHSLKFNGYLRTGMGKSLAGGGEMVSFQLPGMIYKARLGNETGHLVELQLTYKYQEKDSDKSYEFSYMADKYAEYAEINNNQFPATAQVYARINNFYKTIDVWAGRRYYDRYDLHSLDYFWLNTGQNAQFSVGLEQIPMPKESTMKVAVFQFKYDNSSPLVENNIFDSYTLEAKWLDYPISEDWKLNFLFQTGYRPKNDVQGTQYYTKTYGLGLGSWATYSKNNITYTGIAHLRKGLMMAINPYTGKSITEYVGGVQTYDMSSAYTFDIINNFVYDDKHTHAVQAWGLYQLRNYGLEAGTNSRFRNQFSLGARYLHYLSRHFNLAFEISNDFSKDKHIVSGDVFKLTFAPQISWNYGYYSRPVIRPFITYATWSDSLRGSVGTIPTNSIYADKTQGFTAGIQVEMWW